MTMYDCSMNVNRVVSATEFKAKCLSILDDIEQKGAAITVTRRGRPVAIIGPVAKDDFRSLKDCYAGKAKIVGDIIHGLDGVWKLDG